MIEPAVKINATLPSTWIVAAIDDVTTISPKSCADGVDHENPVHFIPMAAVSENFGGIDISQLRPYGEVRKGYTSFSEGDVLFAKITPCMENGKGGLVPSLSYTYAFGSTEFHVLRPTHALLPRWLAHYLSQPDFRKIARQNMTGTAGQMRVSSRWLAETGIPLAPVDEQTRIVEKLEELLSDLDAGVIELKAAQAKLTRYRQSLLKTVVEGKDNDTPYPQVPLAELTKEIGQGWSPKCEEKPAVEVQRWGVIKTTAIQPQAFDGAHNKALPIGFQPRPHLELKVGDLLITRAGPRNRVGICCLVRSTRQKLMLCDKAYRIRCDTSRVEAEFLELVLNAPQFVQQIDALKTGISDSGLNLTQDRFLTINIPLPSLDRQRQLMAEIESIEAMLHEQAMAINSALAQSTAQRNNILRAAFSGQLVPQDPNDEPASALLARIRAGRVGIESRKMTDRKKRNA